MWLKVNTISSGHLFLNSIWSQGVFCFSEAVYALFVSKTTSARSPNNRHESPNPYVNLYIKQASSTRFAEEPNLRTILSKCRLYASLFVLRLLQSFNEAVLELLVQTLECVLPAAVLKLETNSSGADRSLVRNSFYRHRSRNEPRSECVFSILYFSRFTSFSVALSPECSYVSSFLAQASELKDDLRDCISFFVPEVLYRSCGCS